MVRNRTISSLFNYLGQCQINVACVNVEIYEITPVPDMLVAMLNDNKMVGFADDVTVSGNLEASRRWWDTLMQIGPNYRYYPQFTKSWLIVKQNKLEEAVRVFGGPDIQIPTEGERHLGAVIGTEENKKIS